MGPSASSRGFGGEGRERSADIELGATVRADKLRFDQVPDIESDVHGEPGYESESGEERRNLPRDVKQGKTYRHVKVWRDEHIRLDEEA